MDKKIFNRLLEVDDLKKDWEGPFSVIQASIGCYSYLHIMKDFIGESFSFIYISLNKGILTGYLSKKEHQKIGKHIREELEKDEIVDKWCDEYMRYYDEAVEIINLQPEKYLENIEKIKEIYEIYPMHQSLNKLAANYVDLEKNKTSFDKLERARKHTEKFYIYAESRLNSFLEFIKEKYLPDYTIEQLRCFTLNELVDSIGGNPILPPQKLDERNNSSAIYIGYEGIIFLTESQKKEFENKVFSSEGLAEIKGQIANKGYIEAKCRVIINYEKDVNIEEGEILVTGMTDPRYLPLMKKASGFLTDGGGVLCHAAIVARELNKPCIIGTNIATKIFKTGEKLQLDANTGIVRKLD